MKSLLNALKALLPGLTLTALCSGCPTPATDFGAGYGEGYGTVTSSANTGYGTSYGTVYGAPYVPPDTTENRISEGPYSGNAPGSALVKGFPLIFEVAWSPDGSQLAIFALPNTNYELYPHVYLVDAKSGKVTADWGIRNPAELLYQEKEEDPPPSLSWSSSDNGLRVLQRSGRRQSLERVYLHHLQAGKPVATRTVHLPLRYNDPGFRGFSQAELAPDHRALALIERRADSEHPEQLQLLRYDLSSESLTPLGPPLPSTGLQAERPLWSPDMSRLLLLYSPSTAAEQTTSDPGRTRIISIRVSDGQSETLFEGKQIRLQQARLSRGGDELLATVTQGGEELFSRPGARLIPSDTRPEQGIGLLHLNLNTPSASNWYGRQLNLHQTVFWQGRGQVLAAQPDQSDWELRNFYSGSTVSRYRLPDLRGLKLGTPLALSPEQNQLAISLYNPCCTLKSLRTGVHLWDLGRGTLTRVGPDIPTLVRDFPKLALHEQSRYGSIPANIYSGRDKTP